MKRIGIVLLVLLMAGGAALAQNFDFGAVETSTATLVGDLSSGLAIANTLGSTWSNDFIGGFPHFGVGFSAGGALIPTTTLTSVLGTFGINLTDLFPSTVPDVFPFPAVNAEARLGLPFVPMDVGVKFGTIPASVDTGALLGINAEYLSFGVDARYRVLKEGLLLPGVSVGVGYNVFKGGISKAGLLGGAQTITGFTDASSNTYDIRLTDPSLGINWYAQGVDARVQVSKNLLFIRPYVGAGASYSWSGAGAGLDASVEVSKNGGTYAALTEADINAITAAYEAQGKTVPDLSASGFAIQTAEGPTFVPRVFGGLSLNILILKIDANVTMNPLTQELGFTAGARVQL